MDRNLKERNVRSMAVGSLSARRAWIEIADVVSVQYRCQVALRKESVDRNIKLDVSYNIKETRRSPQGERG